MAGKEIAVKKYVVRLSTQERDQLNELTRSGKRSAQMLTKARILLKADMSDAGAGWSDSRIAQALEPGLHAVGGDWSSRHVMPVNPDSPETEWIGKLKKEWNLP